MKRGVIGKLFFVSVLLIFLSSGVFAAAYCSIIPRANCNASGSYILMGLSAATNAHGQAVIHGADPDYPYVLCCPFGTGNLTCTTTPTPNKIIGLSSLTNAHAEGPALNNYQTVKICYEDLLCGTYSTCPTNYGGILSLAADPSNPTNAHIGNFSDYATKICCGGTTISRLSCTLKSATWNTQNSINGQRVYLNVVGSGTECDGDTLSFQVMGGYTPVSANPTNVAFNGATATASWNSTWQDGGLLGGDPSFYFNASLVQNPTQSILSSNPKLTVSNTQTIDYCADITSCSDYASQDKCVADSSLCNKANDSSLPGVDCSDPKIRCGCSWNSNTNQCGFSYSEIKSPLCENGYTLCKQSGIDFCYPGSTCLTGSTTPTNNNGICDAVDSCASSDCTSASQSGSQGSCVTGATCSSGECYNANAVPINITCNYGFTLCRVTGTNYCYPGNKCPTGQYPANNSNGKCGIGSGCLSAECQEGNKDSCANETYCVSGMCSSAQDPVNLDNFGGCEISQTIIKDCNTEPTGYKIINWTGTWTGTDTSGDSYNNCIAGGSSTVPCPAQIQLPFEMGYYGIAITLVVIALVYFFVIFRRKKNTKSKKKHKR
jgi:hypothetical protein